MKNYLFVSINNAYCMIYVLISYFKKLYNNLTVSWFVFLIVKKNDNIRLINYYF